MFLHSADKLAEMWTKFHVIQVKLIMSVWCFTVQCYHWFCQKYFYCQAENETFLEEAARCVKIIATTKRTK